MTRLISLEQERHLPWHTRLQMQLHYAICVWCRRYAAQLQALRGILRRFPEEAHRHSEDALPPDTRERLRQRMAKEKD